MTSKAENISQKHIYRNWPPTTTSRHFILFN